MRVCVQSVCRCGNVGGEHGEQQLGFNKGFGSNIRVFKVQYVEYGGEL